MQVRHRVRVKDRAVNLECFATAPDPDHELGTEVEL
jgi:hypothetical protein